MTNVLSFIIIAFAIVFGLSIDQSAKKLQANGFHSKIVIDFKEGSICGRNDQGKLGCENLYAVELAEEPKP